MSTDKTARIELRISPAEKEELLSKAAESHKTVSQYVLSLSENRRVVDTKKLPPLITEIRRIGVNVNQIAAVANTQKYVSKEMLMKTKDELKKVVGLMQQILDEVYNTDEHTFQSLENKIDKLTAAIERLEKNGSG